MLDTGYIDEEVCDSIKEYLRRTHHCKVKGRHTTREIKRGTVTV